MVSVTAVLSSGMHQQQAVTQSPWPDDPAQRSGFKALRCKFDLSSAALKPYPVVCVQVEAKEATLADLQRQVAAAEGVESDTRAGIEALRAELAAIASAQEEWRSSVTITEGSALSPAELSEVAGQALLQAAEKVGQPQGLGSELTGPGRACARHPV